MKKIIIIAVVILSSALTALSITRKEEKTEIAKLKIEKADFSVKVLNAPKSDLGSAD
jgi:hypothetical protein